MSLTLGPLVAMSLTLGPLVGSNSFLLSRDVTVGLLKALEMMMVSTIYCLSN